MKHLIGKRTVVTKSKVYSLPEFRVGLIKIKAIMCIINVSFNSFGRYIHKYHLPES